MNTTGFCGLSNNHWTNPHYRQRMTTAQWKQMLLQDRDNIIYKGVPLRLQAKKLGYGVVEVYKDITINQDGTITTKESG